MKRASCLLLAGLATLITVLFPASQVTLSEKTTATVKVDCTKGQSINAALASDSKAQGLIVEISGLCHENVVVTRDRVTLRGSDPANDGIEALENTDITDAALWVRGATLFTVENLRLTGGFSGLLATNANLPNIQLTNCRLAGNTAFGLQLENSLAVATDTTFDSAVGTGAGAGVFISSRLACNHCTFTTPGPSSSMIVIHSIASIGQQSSFSGGPVRADGSLVVIADSTISSSSPGVPAVNAVGSSTVNLTRVEVSGRMFFAQSTNAALNAVTQTSIGMQPNEANFGSNVIVGSAGQPGGGPPNINSTIANFNLNNFANLVLNPGSTIELDLVCRTGSNAHCANPANVLGATNCGLCPKP